jgi:hypothetical protein
VCRRLFPSSFSPHTHNVCANSYASSREQIFANETYGRGKELLAQRVCRWLVGRWPLRIYITSTIKIHFLTPIAVDKFQLFKIKSKYATFNHILINKRAMQHLKSTHT